MRFSLKHTRHWLPGVVFVAVLAGSLPMFARSLKPKATFMLDVPDQSKDRDRRGPNAIEYVRSGDLAVWYTEQQAGQLSIRDRLSKTDPWQLKMEIVSTKDGSVSRRMQWPTRRESTDFVVPHNGHAVLLTGPMIHCYTPDFAEMGRFLVKNADQPAESRVLRLSPGGEVIWMVEVSDFATATNIDSSTCTPRFDAKLPRTAANISGNDSMLADANAKQVGIWTPSVGWNLIYRSPCCLSNPHFLAPDLIGVDRLDLDLSRHFLLINLQGELLLDDPVKAGFEDGGVVPSADGKTAVAVFIQKSISSTETGIDVDSIKAKIELYDLAKHKKVGDLEVNIPGEHLFGIAISPDSTEFAILNGKKLSIYDMPH